MKKENKHSILSSQNLSVGYTDFKVINDINLSVCSGELIAVLGKNGSGKSTLIKTLAKILDPLKGTILLKNKELESYKQKELAKLFTIILTEKLPENLLTVLELISMGRQVYTNWFDQLSKVDQEKINFAIKVTHTQHLLSKKFSELSDGQKQKVLLAKAIAQDTPIIFLDEPTTHLDVHHRMETFMLLKDLAHTHNKTIIMATHEVGLSTQLADELWLVNKKSIQIGSPQEMIRNQTLGNIFNSNLIRFNSKTCTFEFR